ncbi:MAG TPA: EamA family transporter RarD [Gemmataceae bacterium]
MNRSSSPTASQLGFAYGLAAYGLWGLVPLYFRAVAFVPPFQLLAHRIVWSLLVLAGLVLLFARGRQLLACFRSRRLLGLLGVSTVLIALNWFAFIYAVAREQVLQTSLGYFITPLVSVALGIFFLGERLRPAQWVALGMALAGVLVLIARGDGFPWIALTLAFSFGLYGLVRKQAGLDGVVGLSVETLLLFPVALGYLFLEASRGRLAFADGDVGLDVLVAASGIVTTVPLLCFAQAVIRLRLTTIGFMQYLSPSIAFLLAVLAFGEPFTPAMQACFGLIWAALAVFGWDLARRAEKGEPPPEASVPSADAVDGSLRLAPGDVDGSPGIDEDVHLAADAELG